jgi:hypothetical protein
MSNTECYYKYCEFSTHNQEVMKHHLLKHKSVFKCDVISCMTISNDYSSFIKHMNKHIEGKGDCCVRKVYKCKISNCNYYSDKKEYYKLHKKIHNL